MSPVQRQESDHQEADACQQWKRETDSHQRETYVDRSRKDWDRHWVLLSGGKSPSIFGFASRLVRQRIFKPAVRLFLEKYFAANGTFLEAGCGTGESSEGVPKGHRSFIGIDFSTEALALARSAASFDFLICADLFKIPLRGESITGIWNLGVMEHFEKDRVVQALTEFRRVLKPKGVVVLFWPAERNSSRWILGPIESIRSALTRRPFTFFPDEVSRLKSRSEARDFLRAAGFETLHIDFSMRTAFIHMVVVGRKLDDDSGLSD